MKFALKKYIYLLNDVTNAMLRKDRQDDKKRIQALKIALIVVAVLLLISLIFNVYEVTGA